MPPMRPAPRAKKARNPRKRTLPRGLKTAFKLGLPVILGVTVVGGGLWMGVSGAGARLAQEVEHQMLALSAEAGLRVGNILISGRERASRRSIENAAQAERGMPILAFDPHRAKERLEMLAWVRTAIVERRLPDTVLIQISERQPLALWQHRGRLALIDTEGVVVTRWKLERFWKLPLVVGAGAPKEAFAMLRVLADHPRINGRVKALVRVSERRWDLRFKNGVVARLPEKDAAQALTTLDLMDRRERLLDRDIVAIDLRYEDRLVVRTKPQTKSNKGKSKTRGSAIRAAQSNDT